MITTAMTTTALLPVASTTLAIGPLALLAFAGVAATVAILIAGTRAELRTRRPAAARNPRLPAALPHLA